MSQSGVGERLLTTKPTFLHELLALPPKEGRQIQQKVELLLADPAPDGHTKKTLKHYGGRVYRLRSGDFRIFYTYDDRYVSVLALRRRQDDTYDEEFGEEHLGGGAAGIEVREKPEQSWDRWIQQKVEEQAEAGKKPLPEPIAAELLERLHVAPGYREVLTGITTEDDLLEAPVPEDVLMRVMDAVLARPLEEVDAQPDLLVGETEDLIRYKEGELIGFLLRLDPEQEKYVRWAVNAKGPTLLKGSPGTGKSTVALYRVREFLGALRRGGVGRPRILFTTYTNALVRFSEQLLAQLLGADATLVEVKTADGVAMAIAAREGEQLDMLSGREVRPFVEKAIANARYEGNALEVSAQEQVIARLDREYLQDEILGVIEGRGIRTLEEYRAAPRPGRRVPFGRTQREAVWRVREAFAEAVELSGKTTWPGLRARALVGLGSAGGSLAYDAVVVDEVQDLQATAIRMLVGLVRDPGRLFLTADANQSIYGGGFRWADVHEDLRFTGRTGILRANHRSTREIGEAAVSYLGGGAIEPGGEEIRYVNSGPLPAVRSVASPEEEADLLARFIRGATRELRLGPGSAAVLCPYHRSTERLADALVVRGLPARAMAGRDLDLGAKEVKLLTLKSAKGLEFPIVAVAGFVDSGYPHLPLAADAEARQEALELERRTLFVAMTRAMRALLVVVPEGADSELLGGFDATLWNLGARDGAGA